MSNLILGKLIIITGKTASGKDTIKNALLTKIPNLKKVITTTSRASREGEKEGIDYYFITQTEFEKRVNNGEFLEFVEYGGNLYGTYRSELEQTLIHDAIWKIDPSRAGQIRKFVQRPMVVIYITTSDDVILQRLKERKLSPEEIEKRMTDDKKIWDQYKDSYDYVLENVPGKLEETIEQISTIINTTPY